MAHMLVEVFFIGVLVVLSVIDIRTRRLPNRILLPAAAVVFAAQLALEPERALEWSLAALGAFAALRRRAAYEPMLVRVSRRFGAIRHVELPIDLADVELHRVAGDPQLLRDR